MIPVQSINLRRVHSDEINKYEENQRGSEMYGFCASRGSSHANADLTLAYLVGRSVLLPTHARTTHRSLMTVTFVTLIRPPRALVVCKCEVITEISIANWSGFLDCLPIATQPDHCHIWGSPDGQWVQYSQIRVAVSELRPKFRGQKRCPGILIKESELGAIDTGDNGSRCSFSSEDTFKHRLWIRQVRLD